MTTTLQVPAGNNEVKTSHCPSLSPPTYMPPHNFSPPPSLPLLLSPPCLLFPPPSYTPLSPSSLSLPPSSLSLPPSSLSLPPSSLSLPPSSLSLPPSSLSLPPSSLSLPPSSLSLPPSSLSLPPSSLSLPSLPPPTHVPPHNSTELSTAQEPVGSSTNCSTGIPRLRIRTGSGYTCQMKKRKVLKIFNLNLAAALETG